jgi:hypothetical protein
VLGVGEQSWVKPHMRLFTKTYKLKAVDFLNLSRGAGLHMFRGEMGEDLPPADAAAQKQGFEAILTLFHLCCNITCNVDGETPTEAMTQR